MSAQSKVEQALAALTRLHPRKIDLSLGRMEAILEALGNPQEKLPPIIHVAGTNGKGSTVAFLRAMAAAQGLRAHVYISPHLVKFNERITLAGEMIGDDALADILHRIIDANGDAPLTFFEATTAAMFLAFSETPADIAIIEVGLGGRYDATNVITPAVSVITPIDYDHAEFLGRDLAKIAREKSGIMKPHMPVISARQSDLVGAVLRSESQKVRAPLKAWGEDFRAYVQQGRLIYESDTELLDLPLPSLLGAHQTENAGTAIAAAKAMLISDKAIAKGLTTAIWPARMQSLTKGPLADIARDAKAELWLDGGHNPAAGIAVSSVMADLEAADSRPLILIMGILANKDAGGYLDAFEGLAAGLIAVEIGGHSSLAPETLCELAAARGLQTQIAGNLTDAVQRALNTGEALSRETKDEPITPPRILICGSLYLSGQVLAME